MLNSKLYFLFKSLDERELRLFSKYVRSPIHNRHEDVIRLFDYLKGTKSWNKEFVFRAVFPETDLDIQKLHYVNSYLIKVLESFLAWQEWEKTDKDIYLLKAYNKKRLDKFFKSKKSSVSKKQELLPQRNVSYHQLNYELEKEEFSYYKESGRSIRFNLQKLSDALDISFIADKLKQTCTILSHQTMLKTEYDLGLINAIVARVEANPDYLKIPAISIYYYAYLSIRNSSNEGAFNQLLELIEISISLFDEKEQRDIYILGINYCIRKMNSGIKNYGSVVFGLYKSGLTNKVFIENGILSKWTYNNIIVAGLKLGEYKWVENFIYNYKELLEEKIREDSFNFNLAKLYVEQKDYDKALPLLIQKKYDDILHTLRVKLMLAKMYYELEELNALENLLDNFKVYFSRKKDIGYHRENYENIISSLRKLVKINPFDKKEIQRFKEEIISFKILTERKWFLEKLNQF